MSDSPNERPGSSRRPQFIASLRARSKPETTIFFTGVAWLLNSFAPWRSRIGAASLNGWTSGRFARFSILLGLASLVLVVARVQDAAFIRGRHAGPLYTGFGAGALVFAIATYGSVPALMSAAFGTWTAILLAAVLLTAGDAIRRREQRRGVR